MVLGASPWKMDIHIELADASYQIENTEALSENRDPLHGGVLDSS